MTAAARRRRCWILTWAARRNCPAITCRSRPSTSRRTASIPRCPRRPGPVDQGQGRPLGRLAPGLRLLEVAVLDRLGPHGQHGLPGGAGQVLRVQDRLVGVAGADAGGALGRGAVPEAAGPVRLGRGAVRLRDAPVVADARRHDTGRTAAIVHHRPGQPQQPRNQIRWHVVRLGLRGRLAGQQRRALGIGGQSHCDCCSRHGDLLFGPGFPPGVARWGQ